MVHKIGGYRFFSRTECEKGREPDSDGTVTSLSHYFACRRCAYRDLHRRRTLEVGSTCYLLRSNSSKPQTALGDIDRSGFGHFQTAGSWTSSCEFRIWRNLSGVALENTSLHLQMGKLSEVYSFSIASMRQPSLRIAFVSSHRTNASC